MRPEEKTIIMVLVLVSLLLLTWLSDYCFYDGCL